MAGVVGRHDFDLNQMRGSWPPPTTQLSLNAAVELAKAGVKVELAHPVDIHEPPVEVPTAVRTAYNDISGGIMERWLQSKRAKRTHLDGDFSPNPQLCAFQHGDKVYVFAYSGNAAPEVIEDEASIYPSDALLARIHLMMQHAK